MRLIACALVPFALLAAPASAQTGSDWARYPAAREVQLRDLAAIVRVVPQARDDVALIIAHPGALPAPELRVSGNRLIVDGKLRRNVRSCDGEGDDFEVEIAGRGTLRGRQLPVIEIRVPRAAVVSSSGAVSLRVGNAASAHVTLSGCGDAEIESVEGEANLTVAGISAVRLFQAGSARVAVAGAGDVEIGAVLNGLTASIAGAGDLTAQRVDGPTSIAVQGAGDVTIRDGRADVLTVVVAGAGDVIHNGSARQLDATVVGAGDVRVRRVEGEVNRRVLGGGEVVVSQR